MVCKLCGSDAPLKKSHIIPKFIGKWMKKTSPTPYLRYSGNIDKRVQDLHVMELLCHDCETRFSAWETKFANEIFYPRDEDETMFWYKPWLLKFAASLAWRAIQLRNVKKIELSQDLNSIIDGMELHLSQFLLGQVKNVGSYTQHIYHLPGLAAPVRPGSPMLNRYLGRAVDVDYLANDEQSEIMVYIKFPMFMILAIGAFKDRSWLETSRIKKSGSIQPTTHVLDKSIFEHIISRSDHVRELFNSMSPESRALKDRTLMKEIEKDPQKVANTKQMQALYADYKFYGKDAVVHRE